MLSKKYKCDECNKLFKSIKSIEYHNKICIYYNYKQKYLNSLLIDKEILLDIISYYNSINCKTDIISQHQILKNIKIKYNIVRNNKLLHLYNIILNSNNLYYNKYEIYMCISIISHYSFDIIYKVLSTYDMCNNNIIKII